MNFVVLNRQRLKISLQQIGAYRAAIPGNEDGQRSRLAGDLPQAKQVAGAIGRL